MSTSIEDRLRDYALRIDDAVDTYAERARTRTVPTAFLESPRPARPRAGGRRLVAAIAVCVIACATVGVVIAQRDPSSRPTRPATHQPAPSPTTTSGPHSTDGSTTVTAPPPLLSQAVDLGNAALFGFAPGVGVDPAAVLAKLTPLLGPPTRDTGWYRTPTRPYDCLGGQTQRILRWGSVSYAFWRQSNPTKYTLWSWTLGDSTVEEDGDRDEPHPIVEQPAIPATTAGGIGIGTTLAAFRQAYGSRLYVPTDGSSAQFDPAAPKSVFIGFAHGKVSGIAGRLPFC